MGEAAGPAAGLDVKLRVHSVCLVHHTPHAPRNPDPAAAAPQVHPEEEYSTTSRPPESPKKPYQPYTQPAAASPPPQQAMGATGQPPPAYGGHQPYGGAYELQTTYAPVQPFASGPTYAYGDPYGQPQYR